MSTSACTSLGGTLGTKTGAQCLEAVTVMYILAKEDQRFASITDFGSKAKWDLATIAEDVVPLWELYEFANANTDATFFESRNFKKQTSKATKIFEAEVFLSLCAHKLLKSYEGSDYTRLYEVTEDGFIIGVLQSDGEVRGQSLKDFNVGIRNNATTDKVPNTKITATFSDYQELENNPAMVQPDFNPVLDLEGIEQVKVQILGTPAPTSGGFTAEVYTECAGAEVKGLVIEDFELINGDGAIVSDATVNQTIGTMQYVVASATTALAGMIKFRLKGTFTDTDGDMFKSNADSVEIS